MPKEVHREYRAAHFMSSGFQRAERAELGKSKLPEVSLQTIYYWRNLYICICSYNFANQSIAEGKMVRRFLRFGFAHGSSGSRFLWFVSYLIFCGSVRRFRLGSWTLLWRKSGCVSCPGGLLGLSSGKLWGGASCHSSWPSGARKLFPTSVHQHSLLKSGIGKKKPATSRYR